MTDISELHAQALDATGRIVRGVAADRWHAATPCAGWDARALVSHLVAGNLWAAELAAGGTIGGVGSRLDGDLLGDDPAAAYEQSAAAAAAVFRRPGALDAPCAGPQHLSALLLLAAFQHAQQTVPSGTPVGPLDPVPPG